MPKIMKFAMLALSSCNFAIADDAADAGDKVHEYFAAFNSQDVQKVANEIYSTPVHIGGGDGHRVRHGLHGCATALCYSQRGRYK